MADTQTPEQPNAAVAPSVYGETTAIFLDDKKDPINILVKCNLVNSADNSNTIVLTSDIINNIKELSPVIKQNYSLMLFLRLNVGRDFSENNDSFVLSQNEFTFNDLINSYDILKEGVSLPFTAQLREELAIVFIVEKIPYVPPKEANKKRHKISLKRKGGKSKNVGVVSGNAENNSTPMEHRAFKLVSFGFIKTATNSNTTPVEQPVPESDDTNVDNIDDSNRRVKFADEVAKDDQDQDRPQDDQEASVESNSPLVEDVD